MQQLKQTLQEHHNKNQHHTQLRINFYYSDMAKNSNNTLLAKQDIQTLVKRLMSKGYIDGYIWGLAFNPKQGIHTQALFYLNEQQHDALAVMAIETLWEQLTHQEGHIVELDVEDDVIDCFTSEITNSLFKHDPHQFIGIN